MTLLVLVAVALLTGAPLGTPDEAASSSTFTIVLQARGETPGTRVLLGDVAELRGGSEADRTALSKTVLGMSPAANERFQVSRAFVADVLSRQGWDASRLRLEGTPACGITLSTLRIGGAELQANARAELEQRLAEAPRDARVEVSALSVPTDQLVPAGRDGVSIEYRPRRGALNGSGTAYVDARLTIDGRFYRSISVPFTLRTFESVLTVTRAIDRNEPLGPNNLAIVEVEVPANLAGRALNDLRDVEERLARRPLRVGEMLTLRDVFRPWTIRRGDPVQLVFVDGRLRLTTSGVAESNGYSGQQIPVTNARSGRRVYGRVLDSRTVAFGPSTADAIAKETQP